MMETDCMNELGQLLMTVMRVRLEHLHVSTEEFDLKCYHSLADPDEWEHAREDQVSLCLAGAHRQKQTQKQAEY